MIVMLLEVQLDGTPIQTLVRNAIRQQRACVSLQVGTGDASIFVDHIELGETTFQPSIATSPLAGTSGFQTKTLEIHQKVIIKLVTLGHLESITNFAPAQSFIASVELDVVFSVQLKIVEHGPHKGWPRFCVQFARLTELTNFLEPQMLDSLEADMAFSQCSDINLAAVAGALPGVNLVIRNCGVAATNDGARLGLRFEVGEVRETQESWASYMSGNLPDRLQGHDWAVYVDSEILTDPLVQQVSEKIPTNKLHLSEPVYATWVPSPPGAVVTIDGEVVDACFGLFGPVDLDVTITLSSVISVPQPNILQIDSHIDWASNAWEVFWCTFSSIVAGPGLSILFGPNSYRAYLGIIASIDPILFVSAIVAVFNSDLPIQLLAPEPPEGFEELSTTHYRATIPFEVPDGLPVTGMMLTTASATASGLILAGTMDAVIELNDPNLVIQPWSDDAFVWKNSDPCSSSVPTLEANIEFADSPYFLHVCPPIFLDGDDPAGQYSASVSQWDDKGISFKLVAIDPDFPPGYDCKVLLLTSGGARYIRISKPEKLTAFDTPEEQLQYNIDLITFRAGHCFPAISIWGKLGIYNPKWGVDPGPDGYGGAPVLSTIRTWSFALTGLSAGDKVNLLLGESTELAHAMADRHGNVRFDFSTEKLEAPYLARDGVTMTLSEYVDSAEKIMTGPALQPAAGMLVERQVELGMIAELHLGETCTFVSLMHLGGRTEMWAGLSERVIRFDLSDPTAPTEIANILVGGLFGVLRFADRVIGVRPGGLVDVGDPNLASILAMPIVGAVARADRLYVLGAEGLSIYDTDFVRVGGERILGATHLVSAGRYLAVAAEGSLLVYEAHRNTVQLCSRAKAPELQRLTRAESLGARAAVYVEDGLGSRVLDIDSAGNVVERVSYKHAPFYFGDPAVGSILVRLDESQTRAQVLRVGGSLSLGRCDGSCKAQPCCGQRSASGRFIP